MLPPVLPLALRLQRGRSDDRMMIRRAGPSRLHANRGSVMVIIMCIDH
jgi:hypothetical protein